MGYIKTIRRCTIVHRLFYQLHFIRFTYKCVDNAIYACYNKEKIKNVIFATTTPVYENQKTINDELIREYNAIIVPELEKIGVKINDLYSFVRPNINEYVRKDDKMHLTEAGIDACSKEIVEVIKSTL